MKQAQVKNPQQFDVTPRRENSLSMSMAVYHYMSSEGSLREFAEWAYKSRYPAAHIANAIRERGGECSSSKAEDYINAYALKTELVQFFNNDGVQAVWGGLAPTYWIRAAELKSRHDISDIKIWNHLLDEYHDRTSTKAFAAHVDSIYNPVPVWKRKINKLADDIEGLFEKDYASEIPPEVQRMLREVFSYAAKRIREILDE